MAVLVEKEATTPDQYPLSLNALKNGCNQKSNRFPVEDYDEQLISDCLVKLRAKEMILTVSGPGSRVRKYEHRFREKLFLNARELAALTVLILRGAQTVGEIRTRTERMVDFENLSDVEETLDEMMRDDRTPLRLVTRLERMPGQKESRYGHLLCGQEAIVVPDEKAVRSAGGGSSTKIAELEGRVAELEASLSELRTAFDTFRQQFE